MPLKAKAEDQLIYIELVVYVYVNKFDWIDFVLVLFQLCRF